MTSVTASSAAAPRRLAKVGSLERQRRWALRGSYAALSVFVVMFLVPPFYMIMKNGAPNQTLTTITEIRAFHVVPRNGMASRPSHRSVQLNAE